MGWALSANGIQNTTAPQTAVFTNGSANIAVPNTAVAGDLVFFQTTGTLPTNFTVGTFYFIIATGLTTANIQVSATPGGSAISAGSAGTGTQTGWFTHIPATDTTNATFQGKFNLTNAVIGDIFTIGANTKDEGSTAYYTQWDGTYQGGCIITPEKVLPFIAEDQGVELFILQQKIIGSRTVTFTNGSAVISATNTFVAGDVVSFSTTGTLPTNFATVTAYYVISTGLSGSQFEVSATAGGSAISAGSAGTGTQTCTDVGRPVPWKLLKQ